MKTFCLSLVLALVATTVSLGEEPSFAAKMSPAQKRFETALAKKVTARFENQPLKEAVATLGKLADVAIALDPEGMEEQSIDETTPVTLSMESVSLKSVLEALELQVRLRPVIFRDELVLTSNQRCVERDLTRVYQVEDLIRVDDEDGLGPTIDFDSLIDLIIATISPDSWADGTGNPGIHGYGNSLVIALPLQSQWQIEKIIAGLRAAKQNHAALKPGELAKGIWLDHSDEIRRKLQIRHSAKIELPLGQYAVELSRITKVSIVLDPQGLDEAGQSAESVVRGELEDHELLSAMTSSLRKLGLAPVIREDYVLITSLDKSEEMSAGNLRLYAVDDLTSSQPETLKALVELVLANVSPGSFATHGGIHSLSSWHSPRLLIASGDDAMHREVEEFLTLLREAKAGDTVRAIDDEKAIRTVVHTLYSRQRAATPAAPTPSTEDVAKLLLEVLSDVSWDEEGVMLKPFHDQLIVRHDQKTLRRVEKWLKKIGAID